MHKQRYFYSVANLIKPILNTKTDFKCSISFGYTPKCHSNLFVLGLLSICKMNVNTRTICMKQTYVSDRCIRVELTP